MVNLNDGQKAALRLADLLWKESELTVANVEMCIAAVAHEFPNVDIRQLSEELSELSRRLSVAAGDTSDQRPN